MLVVSYLANTIRTQIDLSNRLATATLTMGPSEPIGGADGKEGGGNRGGHDGKRGGGRGGRGGNRGGDREREPREQ